MISINNIRVEFSGKDLMQDITFEIKPKDKIGLVGKNGAGKTTLLRLIVKELSPAAGNISILQDVKIGYLPQHTTYPEGKTVFEETMTAFSEVLEIENDINDVNTQLAERTDYKSDEYLELINNLTELNARLQILGSATIESQAEQTLKGLGFEPKDFERPTNELSGGWRMRIELAKILLRKFDVLLLDEPTNHLDIDSIQWLEDFLTGNPVSVVIISHDRRFLDMVCKRTIEISMGKIYDYKANYSKYKEQRKERIELQKAAYENQQIKIKQTKQFIERFRYKATKANQVQSRIKQLEKLEVIEIENEDKSGIHFRFPPAPRAGDIVIEMRDLTKKYDDLLVIDEIDFILERGEKVSFVGRNGEGKTTLVRIILDELKYNGFLKLGHNVNVGYYAQNQDKTLNMDKTVFQTIDDIAVGDVRTQIRAILGSFLFRDDDIDKRVSVLSGGERARLALAKLLLQPYSLLVLDEPTNHLDMQSKDILKKALLQYNGTIILVSHDRYFLDGLSDTIYEFRNHKIRQHKGGINNFLRRKKIQSMQEIELKKKETSQQNLVVESSSKQTYLQRKEEQRRINKNKRDIEKSENKIEEYENKIAEIDKKFAKNEAITDDSIYVEYEDFKTKLQKEMEKWEKLNEEI